MKRYLYMFILFCGFALCASTEKVDVVKLLDGTVYKGSIIEQNLNEGTGWIKVEITGGSIFHITENKIESIESEERELEQVQKKWRPDFWFYITIMVIVEAIL